MVGQYFLNIINIHGFIELFFYARHGLTGYPDLKFGIKVKCTRCFYAEPGNGFVGNGFILCFALGKTLYIDQYQPFIGKDKSVPDQLESELDLLSLDQ